MSVEDETWDRPICESCNKEIPYGKRGDHLNKKCMKEDFMPRLKEIQHELKTQDNRCTADPIFLVEECYRVHGMDYEHTDDFVWYDEENHCEADEEESTKLNNDRGELFDEIDYDAWKRVYYFDKWITVQSFFTEKGAQEYIDRNKHRHAGELRVYADSLYRNPEMKMIRDYVLNLE